MQTNKWNVVAKIGLLAAIYSCVSVQAQAEVQTQVQQNSDAGSTYPKAVAYPSIDAELGEALYPDEEAIAQAIGLAIEQSLRKTYNPGDARRDAHPKAHGCVKAELQVMDTIPKELAQGIFIPGKTYQAWIRFSNGSKDPSQADIEKDARGMAIKVLGIPGEKLLDDEREATRIAFNHAVDWYSS